MVLRQSSCGAQCRGCGKTTGNRSVSSPFSSTRHTPQVRYHAKCKNIDQRVTARFGICANKMLLLVIPVRKTNVTEHFVNIVSCRDIEAHYFKRVAITVSAIIKAPFPPLKDYCTVS